MHKGVKCFSGLTVYTVIFVMLRSSYNFGYVGSKIRSLGQIIEKACERPRRIICASIFMSFNLNVYLDDLNFESCKIKK